MIDCDMVRVEYVTTLSERKREEMRSLLSKKKFGMSSLVESDIDVSDMEPEFESFIDTNKEWKGNLSMKCGSSLLQTEQHFTVSMRIEKKQKQEDSSDSDDNKKGNTSCTYILFGSLEYGIPDKVESLITKFNGLFDANSGDISLAEIEGSLTKKLLINNSNLQRQSVTQKTMKNGVSKNVLKTFPAQYQLQILKSGLQMQGFYSNSNNSDLQATIELQIIL